MVGISVLVYPYIFILDVFIFRVAMQFVARLKKTEMPVCKFFPKFLKIPCNWREQMLIRAFSYIQFDNPIGKAIKYRNDALILGHKYTASETSRNIEFLFKKKMEKNMGACVPNTISILQSNVISFVIIFVVFLFFSFFPTFSR